MYRVGGGQRVALDVRIIAATNAELQKAVEAGRFRRDLYYRLNSGHVRIPPLRERHSEIVHLAQLILARLAEEKRRAFRYISAEARAAAGKLCVAGERARTGERRRARDAAL